MTRPGKSGFGARISRFRGNALSIAHRGGLRQSSRLAAQDGRNALCSVGAPRFGQSADVHHYHLTQPLDSQGGMCPPREEEALFRHYAVAAITQIIKGRHGS